MFGRIALAGAGTLGLAAVLALGVAAARWGTAEAATNCSTSTAGLDSEEIAGLQLINAFRAQNGKPALLVAPTLNTMAAWKSADSTSQVSTLSHTDSLGRGPRERAIDCGYPGGAAENIAAGYPSAASVVQGWINSPGHRANMLGTYAVMGFAHTGSSWVLNLGFAVEPGSFPVGGSQPPPPSATTPAATATPRPTQPSNPTQPPAGGIPTAPAGQTADPEPTQQQDNPAPHRTVLPAKEHPQWSLPANVPVKRAMLQMVASE